MENYEVLPIKNVSEFRSECLQCNIHRDKVYSTNISPGDREFHRGIWKATKKALLDYLHRNVVNHVNYSNLATVSLSGERMQEMRALTFNDPEGAHTIHFRLARYDSKVSVSRNFKIQWFTNLRDSHEESNIISQELAEELAKALSTTYTRITII